MRDRELASDRQQCRLLPSVGLLFCLLMTAAVPQTYGLAEFSSHLDNGAGMPFYSSPLFIIRRRAPGWVLYAKMGSEGGKEKEEASDATMAFISCQRDTLRINSTLCSPTTRTLASSILPLFLYNGSQIYGTQIQGIISVLRSLNINYWAISVKRSNVIHKK